VPRVAAGSNDGEGNALRPKLFDGMAHKCGCDPSALMFGVDGDHLDLTGSGVALVDMANRDKANALILV
jgi:hypothetical protein